MLDAMVVFLKAQFRIHRKVKVIGKKTTINVIRDQLVLSPQKRRNYAVYHIRKRGETF